MTDIIDSEIKGTLPPGPDWSDFRRIEHTFPYTPEGQDKINPQAAEVDLNRLPDYQKFYRNNFQQAFEDSESDRVWNMNNGIVAVLEKQDKSIDPKLMLVPTEGMTPFQVKQLEDRFRELGYKKERFSVPHSSDAGAWIERCVKYGESPNDYSRRLEQVLKSYKDRGIKVTHRDY